MNVGFIEPPPPFVRASQRLLVWRSPMISDDWQLLTHHPQPLHPCSEADIDHSVSTFPHCCRVALCAPDVRFVLQWNWETSIQILRALTFTWIIPPVNIRIVNTTEKSGSISSIFFYKSIFPCCSSQWWMTCPICLQEKQTSHRKHDTQFIILSAFL